MRNPFRKPDIDQQLKDAGAELRDVGGGAKGYVLPAPQVTSWRPGQGKPREQNAKGGR